VEVINGFSAHADRSELLGWVQAMKDRPQKVFVVHGEPESAQSLADGLVDIGISETYVPDRGDTLPF
jgi:metallo-beta-lactamase family protein